MRLAKLLVYFETSPTLHLLRSRNAPYIVDFLDRQFKQSGRIAIPHLDLTAALTAYLEELQESNPDALAERAADYIGDWSTHDSPWLRRFLETGSDEPFYQLTAHAEEVFGFLGRALNRDLGFIGTESHFKMVVETFSDLIVGSSDDPRSRVDHLRKERDRLQREIDQIENDGAVTKYHPAQIRERFSTGMALLRQLQGDFRAVEDSFRNIAMQVQQRQMAGTETRGKILEFALDAEEVLKKEDQGVSFYEFVKLILDPRETERLEQVIRAVRQIPELEPQQEGLNAARNMITSLQNEAERVMRTNRRLSATLRRLLDVRSHSEGRRVGKLLQDIQGLAARCSFAPDSMDVGISLELDLAIDSPFRRTFWVEPPRFASIDLSGFEPEATDRVSAFQQLAAMKRLDWHDMRDRIRHILMTETAPTLGDLLDRHPADAGVIEIIGYVQIAAEDGHLIDTLSTQTVVVSAESSMGSTILVTIPRVTFLPPRTNGHAR